MSRYRTSGARFLAAGRFLITACPASVYNYSMNRFPDPGMVCIDGSFGEGGGQILRTSLALSCVLGKPVEITNIRMARRKPGLQPQHLTAVMAAAAVSDARYQGAELSSTALRFLPGRTGHGAFRFDVAEKQGSAGSTSLVLQTILLPLCFAGGSSTIAVHGGTHVPWSPPFHYLHAVVAPLLARIGVQTEFSIDAWGWYPAGGGRVSARILPVREFLPLNLADRGRRLRITGISAVSNLPEHIAVRQRDRAYAVLEKEGIEATIEILLAPSPGKGSFLFLVAECENIRAGFGSLGAIGKRAEAVAEEACAEFLSYLGAQGALDPHLADQIVPWLACCHGPSEFTVSRITGHLLTNLWVVRRFMNLGIEVAGQEGEEGRILIQPGRD